MRHLLHKLIRRHAVQLLFFISMAAASSAFAGAEDSIAEQNFGQRPNIVLIMADDLGCRGGNVLRERSRTIWSTLYSVEHPVFEVVAFLHTGLLAFDPVGGFLNYSVQFVNTLNSQDISFAFRVIRTLSSPTLRVCC
jgi:hypothetical protein